MPKPRSELIQLSYPGILDGTEYNVPVGTQTLKIPDPAELTRVTAFEQNPSIVAPLPKPLIFIRRPHSNVFVLENK